ncbi:quinoprotein dehydrogenase-associated putative ABC transporter substrate-binding protein [Hyphomicrobium sp. CS1GBMeth3]|uniref:quinoprotein dehydrogenase-associated putative ABC transporter substrate-binding protein n=1 Tax=Hyphomicrobium sp. CS1GBMeth3 TaxID=1892845 RepID=UPI0009306B72|nr:quinoprotein dehydrogenase-associated putative ABC transporter substrate-binding protein [Hyphomicrobium sp. CS1GBMeth3]
MFSRCLKTTLAAGALAGLAVGQASGRELRVCADPDNLPYSHQNGQGFENELMRLIGREIGADIKFVWMYQWRGFVRKTLRSGVCDVIPGMAVGTERARLTRPYYTSSYAFVTRTGKRQIRSFAELSNDMKIGVQLVGDDGINTPPVEELAARGINAHVKGYMVWGQSPPRGAPLESIMRAVADGTVEVAIVWGPQAGYFATREDKPLTVASVPTSDKTVQPMRFEIAMGVRKNDVALAAELDAALAKLKPEIDALLDSYDVPRSTPTAQQKDAQR